MEAYIYYLMFKIQKHTHTLIEIVRGITYIMRNY